MSYKPNMIYEYNIVLVLLKYSTVIIKQMKNINAIIF